MIKNVLLAAAMAFGFPAISPPVSAAYVYVQVGPPAPIVETAPAVPGPGYVWVGGYWRWNGVRYVWVPGTWVHHPGAWCPGHWRHLPDHGWYWVPGHWC